MAKYTKNPLFRRASKRVQQAARREWKRTDAAKAIHQIQAASRMGGSMGGGQAVRKAMSQWGRGGINDLVRSSLLSSDFGSLIREVQKYSRMGGSTGRLLSTFLGEMGPIGSLIRSVLGGSSGKRSSGVQGDIQSAIDFLDAVAPDALSSRGRKRSTMPAARRSGQEVADQIEAAKEFLEGEGFEVKPKSPGGTATDPSTTQREKTYPGGVSKTTARGQPRKVVDIDIGSGRNRRFPVDHPIVTKRMIQTPESTNVYAYSYDVDSWTLYVRFRSGETGAAGSLYSYSHVTPAKFLLMYAAPSKGTFIWDHLRIRGTISGHQHDYQLVAVRNNYVPRKATMTGKGEMLVPRTVRVKRVGTGKIRVLKSGGAMRPGFHPYG